MLTKFMYFFKSGLKPIKKLGNDGESLFDGKVVYFSGYRDFPRPFNYHVVKIKRSAITQVHTNGKGFLGTAKYFWDTRTRPDKADVVINGDEGSPVVVKGFGISDGKIYKADTVETCVQWGKDGQVLGMSSKILDGCWNACGGSNIVLENGELHWSILDKPSVDPRTSFFWNDEWYIIIVIDGRNDGTFGLKLTELGEFAKEQGATDGHNFDGGDSCSLLINGEVKNNPPEGYLHSVVNHVGFWINTEAVEIMEYTHRVVKDVGLRPIPSMDSSSLYNIKAGVEFIPDSTEVVNEFGQVVTFQNYNGLGWLPMVWDNGSGAVTYVEEIKDVPPIEPPLEEVKPIMTQVTMPDGSVWEADNFERVA